TGACGLERDVEGLERCRRDTFALVDQSQEDVLGPDVVVVEQACFFLSGHDHPAGSVGEAFEHALTLRPTSTATVRRSRRPQPPGKYELARRVARGNVRHDDQES